MGLRSHEQHDQDVDGAGDQIRARTPFRPSSVFAYLGGLHRPFAKNLEMEGLMVSPAVMTAAEGIATQVSPQNH